MFINSITTEFFFFLGLSYPRERDRSNSELIVTSKGNTEKTQVETTEKREIIIV